MTNPSRSQRWLALALGLASVVGLTAAVAPGAPAEPLGFQGESGTIGDLDVRTASLSPTAEQLDLATALDADVRWNRFGTPHTIIRPGGWIAEGLAADPVQAARDWLSDHRALFRLSQAGLDDLEVLNDSPLGDSGAHVVLLRQRFGDLPAAEDGMVTLGVDDGRIAYVSSSIAGDGTVPAAAAVSPSDAWRIAADDAGRVLPTTVTSVVDKDGWTILTVDGLAEPQRARLRSLPVPGGEVRPVWETVVLDNDHEHGAPVALTHLVDAVTGDVLVRRDRVDHLAEPATGFYTGATGTDGACGPQHEFLVAPGMASVDLVASATVPADDIVLNLVHGGEVVATFDSLTSPEAVHYAPAVLEPGTYAAQVCAYDPATAGFDYSGTWTVSPVGATALPYPPAWDAFPANPPVDHSTDDTRQTWCWQDDVEGVPVPGCDRELANDAARAPWDVDPRTGLSTATTLGNAAKSGAAWLAPNTVQFGSITPGENYQPLALDRQYGFDWTNQWYETSCDPTVFASTARNDVDAAATNLFVAHNRMHDYAYHLGFTEQNHNMQLSNFGNGQPGPFPGREGDPEIGNVQAGAITGGPPTFGGRDNANQLTLQDGIAPITNMYLWQPIAGVFYPACVDGDYDMSVVGHEYTHAISNRMVGGPDAGLSGFQAGSMGESWSDLVAMEYLHAYGFMPSGDENPWSVGSYVTGDPETGIRNYALDANPLNYSDVGYDLTGAEVHADGEIWNAVQFEVRRAMQAAWDAQYPWSDAALQERCADGELPADVCPGNRRWVQLMFDAFLLSPPDVSMVDARDAMLAADMLRFDGANQAVLWDAYARTGLGRDAVSAGSEDTDPTPSFASPLADNATVTFVVVDPSGTPVGADVHVGRFEARTAAIADTDPDTALPASAEMVAGSYELLVRADGYGAKRVPLTVTAGRSDTVIVTLRPNLASVHAGAVVSGDGVNLDAIADDTEATNWASLDGVEGRAVVIDLAGDTAQHVTDLNVSAMLHPATETGDDPGSQNRFTALRQFEVQVCDATTGADCSDPAAYTSVYTSAPDAFPGHRPRPRVPDLALRGFDVPDVDATHVRIVVLTSQCSGAPEFSGEQDADPTNDTDCVTADPGGPALIDSPSGIVRIAEVQVFADAGPTKGGGNGKGKGRR